MRASNFILAGLAMAIASGLSGCGPINLGEPSTAGVSEATLRQRETFDERRNREQLDGRDRGRLVDGRRETIFDLFRNVDDPNVTVEVNKYIWAASQQVLDFLPVQAVDPFSGVIVYGYGTPPGGGQAYRATVYVRDPALDARSLNVALATRSGPATPDTVRAIEDAILTRARQLRIRDADL